MRIIMIFYSLLVNANGLLPIRGYSVNWRNANDQIVKKATYNRAAVFTPAFQTEIDELNKLPNGYEYKLTVINSPNVQKILYKSKPL